MFRCSSLEVGDRIGIGVTFDDENRAQYFTRLHGRKRTKEVIGTAAKSPRCIDLNIDFYQSITVTSIAPISLAKPGSKAH